MLATPTLTSSPGFYLRCYDAVMTNCLRCGKKNSRSRQTFCSKSCAKRSSGRPDSDYHKKCPGCSSPVVRAAQKFCSRSCSARRGTRKSDSEYLGRYRLVDDPSHPLSDASGRVREHRRVLFEKIGDGIHSCHWCGDLVTWMVGVGAVKGALQADHVNGNKLDNRPKNLVPSCHVCNTRRGNRILIGDEELFVTASNGTRHRATRVECPGCGQEFLMKNSVIKYRGVGHCGRSCARTTRSGRAKM